MGNLVTGEGGGWKKGGRTQAKVDWKREISAHATEHETEERAGW